MGALLKEVFDRLRAEDEDNPLIELVKPQSLWLA